VSWAATDAVQVLPEHSARSSASWWWLELAVHGVSVWDYVAAAVAVLGYGDWYEEGSKSPARAGLTVVVDRWRASDRMLTEWQSWLNRTSSASTSAPATE